MSISGALWKLLLRMWNAFDGALRFRNMSKPKAKTNNVDLGRAGAVTIRCTVAT